MNISDKLVQKLDNYAEELGVPRNSAIAFLLAETLSNKELTKMTIEKAGQRFAEGLVNKDEQ